MLHALYAIRTLLTQNTGVMRLATISILSLSGLAMDPAAAETEFELQALVANHEQSRSAEITAEAALSDSLTVAASVGRERADDPNEGSARGFGFEVEWYGLPISESVEAGISVEMGRQHLSGGVPGTVRTPSQKVMAIDRWALRPALEISLGVGVSRERESGNWTRQNETSIELEYGFENDVSVKLKAEKSGSSDPVAVFEATIPTTGQWSLVLGIEQQAAETTVQAGLSVQF